jgi:4-carboxymuconolactone decarboxylase
VTVMRPITTIVVSLALALTLVASVTATTSPQMQMIVRLSEIEIAPEYLEEYVAILKKESAASVRLEPGVISIFPMSQQDHPTRVRILEIYANRAAYESHLQTPHFQEYKTTTLKMVKSLKLVDMRALDPETMSALFKKLP